MIKRIMAIIGTALLSLCVGLVIPLAVAGNVSGLQVDKEQLKANAGTQFKEEMARLVDADFESRVTAEMDTQIAAGREQLAALNGGTEKKSEAGFSEQANQIYADSNSAERAEATVLAGMSTAVGYPIQADSPDLNKDTVLASYVDAGYLSGLAQGGLTPEEDATMQSYLKARFLPAEYDRAKDLNYKYAILIKQ